MQVFFVGPNSFVPGVCERLEPYLLSEVVGQELAVSQLSDAICDHVSNENPIKPLIVSIHGPPGVGKSMSHLLAARALYNQDPSPQTQCPGPDCPGYKVTLPNSRHCQCPSNNQHSTPSCPLTCSDHLSDKSWFGPKLHPKTGADSK